MGILDTTLGRDSEETILSSQRRRFGEDDEDTRFKQRDRPEQHNGILRTQQLTVVHEDLLGSKPKKGLEVWGNENHTG